MPPHILPVAGFESFYNVSDDGKIHSIRKSRVMKTSNANGYQRLILHGLESKAAYVHRIVAIAFLGEPPPGQSEVNHINGDKADNRAVNLEWVSRRENAVHAKATGRYRVGENHPSSKLNTDQVAHIKSMIGTRFDREIAAMFGVSLGCIYAIKRGESWKTVEPLQPA